MPGSGNIAAPEAGPERTRVSHGRRVTPAPGAAARGPAPAHTGRSPSPSARPDPAAAPARTHLRAVDRYGGAAACAQRGAQCPCPPPPAGRRPLRAREPPRPPPASTAPTAAAPLRARSSAPRSRTASHPPHRPPRRVLPLPPARSARCSGRSGARRPPPLRGAQGELSATSTPTRRQRGRSPASPRSPPAPAQPPGPVPAPWPRPAPPAPQRRAGLRHVTAPSAPIGWGCRAT